MTNSEDTIDVPVFGTHTRECYERGWFDFDRESDCLRPSTVTRPLTDAELLDIEVRQERTQDAAS